MVRFPPPVEFGGQQYTPLLYRRQALQDSWIAFDCETELIKHDDPRHVPALALAAASGNRDGCYLVHPDQVGHFILTNVERHWVGHNVTFDFHVVDQYLHPRGSHPSCSPTPSKPGNRTMKTG